MLQLKYVCAIGSYSCDVLLVDCLLSVVCIYADSI